MPGVCTSVVALLGCAGDLSLTDPTLAPGTSVAKFCAADTGVKSLNGQQIPLLQFVLLKGYRIDT